MDRQDSTRQDSERTAASQAARVPKLPVQPTFKPRFNLRLRAGGAVLVGGAIALLAATQAWAQERSLVGLFLNGQEISTLEVLVVNETYLIPLHDFAALAGCQVEVEDGNPRLTTPLGIVELTSTDVQTINGLWYITEEAIAQKLAAPVEFNAGEFALDIALPWRQVANSQQPSDAAFDAALQPQVRPPRTTVATVRQELTLFSAGNTTQYLSSTKLRGRFLGGSWRLQVDNNFHRSPDISEFYWYQRQDQTRYLVGQQQLRLHPLLPSTSLTGVQVGWTNLSPQQMPEETGDSVLLPRYTTSVRTFRGSGPPAGFAELRVDGLVIAQQQVGLDGQYEFRNVAVSVGQSDRIEVLIYTRDNLNVPIAIQQQTVSSSDLLLPAGGVTQVAGLGMSGSILNPSSDSSRDLIGFYQWRQGFSSDFTAEATVQQVDEALQLESGFTWRVADPWIVSAQAAYSRDRWAYWVDVDAQYSRWRMTGNARSIPQGFHDEEGDRLLNHSFEVRYQPSDTLTVGAIARHYEDEFTHARYLLPTVSWRPSSNLSINGRPDLNGTYLVDAFYQITPTTQFTALLGESSVLNLSQRITPRDFINLTTNFGEDDPYYSLDFTHVPERLDRLGYRIGLAQQGGNVGLIVGGNLELIPGIFARAEYQSIPVETGFEQSDQRFVLSLVSDFTFSQGQLLPANTSAVGSGRGAIAGRIVTQGTKPSESLAGVSISVRRGSYYTRVQTNDEGNFFVGYLPDGIYLVELDPAELPFGLNPVSTSTVVEVARGAVTTFDFAVRPEFGLAGRVMNSAGQPMPHVPIQLVDATGVAIAAGATDQFGLYRLDAIPPGSYTLRIPQTNSSRPIEVVDDFLFEQDLHLEPER